MEEKKPEFGVNHCIQRFQDLVRLYFLEFDADIVFEVNKKQIKAHRFMLRNRAQYFEKVLENIQESTYTYEGSAEAFHLMMIYLYTGIIIVEGLSWFVVFELLKFARKFLQDDLSVELVGVLADKITEEIFLPNSDKTDDNAKSSRNVIEMIENSCFGTWFNNSIIEIFENNTRADSTINKALDEGVKHFLLKKKDEFISYMSNETDITSDPYRTDLMKKMSTLIEQELFNKESLEQTDHATLEEPRVISTDEAKDEEQRKTEDGNISSNEIPDSIDEKQSESTVDSILFKMKNEIDQLKSSVSNKENIKQPINKDADDKMEESKVELNKLNDHDSVMENIESVDVVAENTKEPTLVKDANIVASHTNEKIGVKKIKVPTKTNNDIAADSSKQPTINKPKLVIPKDGFENHIADANMLMESIDIKSMWEVLAGTKDNDLIKSVRDIFKQDVIIIEIAPIKRINEIEFAIENDKETDYCICVSLDGVKWSTHAKYRGCFGQQKYLLPVKLLTKYIKFVGHLTISNINVGVDMSEFKLHLGVINPMENNIITNTALAVLVDGKTIDNVDLISKKSCKTEKKPTTCRQMTFKFRQPYYLENIIIHLWKKKRQSFTVTVAMQPPGEETSLSFTDEKGTVGCKISGIVKKFKIETSSDQGLQLCHFEATGGNREKFFE